jgi:GNAT superfamily N-acetyltransferase
MQLTVVSMAAAHIEQAATLVVDRYSALRERVPLLPVRYRDMATMRMMLSELEGRAPGVVALSGGDVVGFLIGFVIPEFRGRRAVFSPEWANGARRDVARRAYEDMYTHLSAQWVHDGCLTHLISLLPEEREAIETFHWLGFGMIAADGLRGMDTVQCRDPGVTIRRGDAGDLRHVAELDEALDRHVAAAPTFLQHIDKHDKRYFEEWMQNPANALWLAFRDGEPVAFLAAGPASAEACTIIRDEKTMSITAAYTAEPLRGRGIAAMLLNSALSWGRSEGYERCAVDFEPMNPPATRFWLEHFQPVSYTLARQIDEGGTWGKQAAGRHETRERLPPDRIGIAGPKADCPTPSCGAGASTGLRKPCSVDLWEGRHRGRLRGDRGPEDNPGLRRSRDRHGHCEKAARRRAQGTVQQPLARMGIRGAEGPSEAEDLA